MLALRSHLFNVVFYAMTILMMICALPWLATRHGAIAVAQVWGRTGIWLLRVICGTRVEFRGLERLPRGGQGRASALILASKHQSFLETFALVSILPDAAFILKRELTWIPLFGWYLGRAGMVPIDRSRGARAIPEMNRAAGIAMGEGRQLIIFPEGTRRPPGALPAYKVGAAHLYTRLGVPCVPVAVNSGLYWPRRSVLRRPGTIVIAFLEPIAPGMPRDAFAALVQERIETASDALLAAGRAELGDTVPALAST